MSDAPYADLFSVYVEKALENLATSKCHSDFEHAFHELTGILYLDGRESVVSSEKLVEIVHR